MVLHFTLHLGIADTTKRILPMLNLVDSYYKFLNTRVVLSKLIIWTEGNLAPVTSNARETLLNLESYVDKILLGKMQMRFDHAHLVIYKDWGNLGGMYLIDCNCKLR